MRRPSVSRSSLSRPRIGYITPRISDHNGRAIWSGIAETAQARGVDVLCFVGGEVQHPDGAGCSANAIYDLVDPEGLDGLLVWGSSLGYYAGPEATLGFCRRFEPLPLVSIGIALPGITGVVLDSYGGTRAAMSHLIEVHGRRRLAFIRGPALHREAGERYRAYCDALTAYGLHYDPDLVSPPYLWVQADGSELRANGAEAVRLFVGERRVQFDALVAASDTFALGALPALQARGVRVPEEVALVGFDNKLDTRLLIPPLTTVSVHMRERGRQALSMLLARLAGEHVPDEVTVPAHLVIRRSCGCSEPAATPVTAEPAASTQEQRAAVLEDLGRELASIDEVGRRALELLDAYHAELYGAAAGRFLLTLNDVIEQTMQAGGEVWVWRRVITALRARVLPHLQGDRDTLRRAEDLLHEALLGIGEQAWRAQACAVQSASQQAHRLHALRRSLAAARDVDELMDVLASHLPELGIGSCWVALYENPQAPTETCRLVLAYDERGRASLPPEGESRPAHRLASGELLADASSLHSHPARTLIVQPLYYRDEQLGLIMLDGSRGDGEVYRVLQEEISAALKGLLLLEENRRLYQAALAAQHAAQDKQRVAEEADRLKSRFLSMVSHELRTPLILLEGLSEMMLRDGSGARPPMPAPYRQDLARIRATAQQLSGLVRDVLDLARSQVGQLQLTLRPLDIAAALQPTLLMGEQMAREKGLDWQAEIAPALPVVRADCARLQEVTLNLISNAVKFTARGEVRLRIEATADRTVTVSISDTGLGVPMDEQEAIFDEFRQSERTATRGFGGLGVGLAICRQIVQLHGGTIGVRSSGREDGGSLFFFTLPALEPLAPATARENAAEQPLPRVGRVVLLTEDARSGAVLHAHLLAQGFAAELLAIREQLDWLAQLMAAPPEAIVLDLQPDGERGWQLVDTLKHNTVTQHIPLLLYSLLVERGQGAVLALDYLAKPMGAAALTQALRNLGLADDGRITNEMILIADDDPAVLALHTDIVREHFPGCRIITAENGAQVLDILKRGERPLFILLDLLMPELDGMGVVEAMQRDAGLRQIPVIVLTAQCLSEADMGGLSRGVTSILQKGMFTMSETLAQIDEALARNKRLGSEPQRLVRKVMAYVHTHYAEDLSREQLASHAGMSPRHLTRCFAVETGLSPMDYLNRFRITQACRLLENSEMSVTEVMSAVGFSNSSNFSRIFRREVGMPPSAYRRSPR